MLDHLTGRYGHRGAWLIILGAVWFVFGIGILLETSPPRSWVLVEYVPEPIQALGWWLTGVAAIWQGFRGPATPRRPDQLGHVALYAMPALRLLSFLLSWLLWLSTSLLDRLGLISGVIGWRDAWYAVLVWLLIAVMLHLVSSWANPRQPLPHPPLDARGDV